MGDVGREVTESNSLSEAASFGACYSGFLISVDLNCCRTMAWSLLSGLLLKKSVAAADGVSRAKYLPDQNTCEIKVMGGGIQVKGLHWLLFARSCRSERLKTQRNKNLNTSFFQVKKKKKP